MPTLHGTEAGVRDPLRAGEGAQAGLDLSRQIST